MCGQFKPFKRDSRYKYVAPSMKLLYGIQLPNEKLIKKEVKLPKIDELDKIIKNTYKTK